MSQLVPVLLSGLGSSVQGFCQCSFQLARMICSSLHLRCASNIWRSLTHHWHLCWYVMGEGVYLQIKSWWEPVVLVISCCRPPSTESRIPCLKAKKVGVSYSRRQATVCSGESYVSNGLAKNHVDNEVGSVWFRPSLVSGLIIWHQLLTLWFHEEVIIHVYTQFEGGESLTRLECNLTSYALIPPCGDLGGRTNCLHRMESCGDLNLPWCNFQVMQLARKAFCEEVHFRKQDETISVPKVLLKHLYPSQHAKLVCAYFMSRLFCSKAMWSRVLWVKIPSQAGHPYNVHLFPFPKWRLWDGITAIPQCS